MTDKFRWIIKLKYSSFAYFCGGNKAYADNWFEAKLYDSEEAAAVACLSCATIEKIHFDYYHYLALYHSGNGLKL